MSNYLDPKRITAHKRGDLPPNPYRSGYGKKIPSSMMIQLDGKPQWRRVYVMCWSNAGTSWVTVGGERLLIASGDLPA